MSKLTSGHYLFVFLSACLALAGCNGDAVGTLQVTYQGLEEGYEVDLDPDDYTLVTVGSSDGVVIDISSTIYDSGGNEITTVYSTVSNANYAIPAGYMAYSTDIATVVPNGVTEYTVVLEFARAGLDGINVGFEITEGPSAIYAVMSPGPSLLDNEDMVYTAGFTNPNGDTLSGGIEIFCIDDQAGGTTYTLVSSGTRNLDGVTVEDFSAAFKAATCASVTNGSPLGLAVTTVSNGTTFMAAAKANAYYVDEAARLATRRNDPADIVEVSIGALTISGGITTVPVTVQSGGSPVTGADVGVYNKRQGAQGSASYGFLQTDNSGLANVKVPGTQTQGELNAAIMFPDPAGAGESVFMDINLTGL